MNRADLFLQAGSLAFDSIGGCGAACEVDHEKEGDSKHNNGDKLG
jgi:hypothetical protein